MDLDHKTSDTKIRIAVPEDAPAIASVLLESFIEYKSHYTPEGFAATTPSSAQIQDRLTEGLTWVVTSSDRIVGTVSVVPRDDSLYVRGMAIVPAARGKGVGKLLLRQVELYASEFSYQRLFLSTTPFLERAISLYEHYGFKRTSAGPDDLFGTPIFTMEKLLAIDSRQ
jgi:putative acetyltransferase